jgi:hypothetical protein
MGPADFLIMPIQRITRYGLLLKGIVIIQGLQGILQKDCQHCVLSFVCFFLLMRGVWPRFALADLRKHTPVSNPDYNDLDSAIKMITGLAIAMNHAQKRN